MANVCAIEIKEIYGQDSQKHFAGVGKMMPIKDKGKENTPPLPEK